MTLAAILPLELARPGALFALVFPLSVLLGSRVFDRPAALATGTLDLWERVRTSRPTPSRRARTRIPPAVWVLSLGLGLGALALAGPRMPRTANARAFRVFVDKSPSMELPLGAGTRRDRAVSMAREWLERHEPGARADWIDRALPFEREDDASDVLWVTDRTPSPPPERAGFFASGGPAVHGPIAVDGSTRYDWDGERIVEVPGGAPRRRVVVQEELPPPIARALDAWAGARGADLTLGGGEIALTIRGRTPSPAHQVPRKVEAGRDGWTAGGSALGDVSIFDGKNPLSTWLADTQGHPIVTSGPGRIDCAWLVMEEPRGDPAAFAVSWAALFDSTALPPTGVVDLVERLAAGEAVIEPPRESAGGDAGSHSSACDAWLAAASLGCILLALGLAGFLRIE